MMRSLYSGVTGMRNHQVRMDVVGNNIANANTLGFKSSRVSFQESIIQQLRPASRPTSMRGGINPMQMGIGMQVGSIDTIFSQGALETTGRTEDLAINGDGFFVVGSGASKFYTRVGNFGFDATGRMVQQSTGYVVQGTMADANGTVPPLGTMQDIVIPQDLQSPAQATTSVSVLGNLDSRLAAGETVDMQVTAYDSLGDEQVFTITFTKGALPNEWTWDAQGPGGVAAGNGTATFNPDGTLNAITGAAGGITFAPAGANPITIDLDAFGSSVMGGLTQYAEPSTAYASANDGYSYGVLEDISIDDAGYITGSFTNGTLRVLAQLAVGRFTNPEGLTRSGSGLYSQSSNSGNPSHMYASDMGDLGIVSGALEMSNVDLTREFTDMITTQRGFQSNARVITVSDEMLMEVANLKR